MRDNMAIIVSQKEWKKGISNSHYEGVANLRNINIDDLGVLRVGDRPSEVHELEGTLLDLRKNYYDFLFDYYAVVKERNGNGRGAIYQSKSNAYYDGFHSDITFSGGVTFKNYLLPFPTKVNEDAGYMLDSDLDGVFEARGAFTELLTEGTEQTYLQKIQTQASSSNLIAVLSDTHYAIHTASNLEIRLISDNSLVHSIPVQADNICRVDSSHVAVAYAPGSTIDTTNGHLKIFNFLTGIEVASQVFNPAGGNGIANRVMTTRSDGRIVFGSQVIYNEGDGYYLHRIELNLYKWDGTTLTTDGGTNLSSSSSFGRSFLFNFKIAGIGQDAGGRIVCLIEDTGASSRQIFVLEKTGVNTWNYLYTGSVTSIVFGEIAQIDTFRVLLGGQKRTILSWDEATDLLTVFNDNLITPPGEINALSAYNKYIMIGGGWTTNNNGIYLLIEGEIEYTPAIVGQDDFVYYANGSNVASLQEIAGTVFDPTDTGTYSVNFSALDLPSGTVITAFGEVERFLSIGTKSGKLYFWDRMSDSFEFPVNIGEPIASIGTKNNLLYVVAQDSGNVYVANMTSFQKIKNLASLTFERFGVYTNGLEFFDDGAYVGAKIAQDPTYTGIWVYRNEAWTLIGTEDQVEDIIKTAPSELIFATDKKIYSYNVAGKANAVWSDDEAYLVSRMEQVGTVANKSKATSFSIYFDNPLDEGEGFKLFYRTATAGEWEPLLEVTSEQLGEINGLFAYNAQLSVPQVEQIQYKLAINTTVGMVRCEII